MSKLAERASPIAGSEAIPLERCAAETLALVVLLSTKQT